MQANIMVTEVSILQEGESSWKSDIVERRVVLGEGSEGSTAYTEEGVFGRASQEDIE